MKPYGVVRVIQKAISQTQNELEKKDCFSIFFNIVPLDINTQDSKMLKHCNCTREEVDFQIFQKFLHNTHDHIVVSKMATTQVRFKFRKQEESDGSKTTGDGVAILTDSWLSSSTST